MTAHLSTRTSLDGTARPRPARRRVVVAGVATAAAAALVAWQSPASASAGGSSDPARGFVQTNLVSDQAGHAMLQDPNLVNAWGLSEGPSTPVWVSDNGTDVTTLYSAGPTGTTPSIVPLVVKVPGGAPTGQFFNDTAGFGLGDGASALFVFGGEGGKVSAWNPGLVPITSAVRTVNRPHSVIKGVALVHRMAGPVLLAADFHNGRVLAFGEHFHPIALPSWAFADPTLPAGYAPFNIAEIGSRVFVTYAKQDAARHDDTPGHGHGFIDVYDRHGHMLQRFASGGVLNSPWGLTIAPSGFGPFAGDLLVGNFGDGRIHAFDPWSGHLDGTLRDASGHMVVIDGLWGLLPGNGTTAPADSVWFSAGPDGESHGLLGLLRSTAA